MSTTQLHRIKIKKKKEIARTFLIITFILHSNDSMHLFSLLVSLMKVPGVTRTKSGQTKSSIYGRGDKKRVESAMIKYKMY